MYKTVVHRLVNGDKTYRKHQKKKQEK